MFLKNHNQLRETFSQIKRDTITSVLAAADPHAPAMSMMRPHGLLTLYPMNNAEQSIVIDNAIPLLMQRMLIQQPPKGSPGEMINALIDIISRAIAPFPFHGAGISMFLGGTMTVIAEEKGAARKAALFQYSMAGHSLVEHASRDIRPPLEKGRFWPSSKPILSPTEHELSQWLQAVLQKTMAAIQPDREAPNPVDNHLVEVRLRSPDNPVLEPANRNPDQLH